LFLTENIVGFSPHFLRLYDTVLICHLR
jgi:hypothetical protein